MYFTYTVLKLFSFCNRKFSIKISRQISVNSEKSIKEFRKLQSFNLT